MKKIILMLSVLVVLVSFCSCGNLNFRSGTNYEKADVASPEIEETEEKEDVTEVTQSDYTENEVTINPDHNTTRADSENYDDKYDIMKPDVRFITYDTPDDAGVNLRAKPDNKSELLAVIPEGKTVLLISNAKTANGYWRISVVVDSVEYTGYVMERYVSTFTWTAFDSIICYDTPNHAGVVLRADDSATSEGLMTVPEGTEVRVWEHEPTGDYWCVDVFVGGRVYKGYVLGKYVEYTGVQN